jgi:DinB superfamily
MARTKELGAMANEQVFASGAVSAWDTNIERADKLFGGLTPDQLAKEIAPGKNRLIYLLGHLTAVHDRMLPLLGLGPRLHAELDEIFISKPDRAVEKIPSADNIKKSWAEVNGKLRDGFARFSAADWLQRHTAVSVEDFAKEPQRNRFAVLLSRTNHLSYHLGQAVSATK